MTASEVAHYMDQSSFRIFGLCIVKNENDIIGQSLDAAKSWCDAVYVYDNGSEDGTWETVLELARRQKHIVPFRQEAIPYLESLRGRIFANYRHLAREGDWWCRLDADEFYIDQPREFLKSVPADHDTIWSASFQYYFTDADAARYEADPEAYSDTVPVSQKCRYYRNDWSEPRFFRHRPEINYENRDWPTGLGAPHPVRIRLKHYQYRSPSQIATRLATRRPAMRQGMFKHESVPEWIAGVHERRFAFSKWSPDNFPAGWHERVVSAKEFQFDDGESEYVINERALPPIRWI